MLLEGTLANFSMKEFLNEDKIDGLEVGAGRGDGVKFGSEEEAG